MVEEQDAEIAKAQQWIREQVQANLAEMRAAEVQTQRQTERVPERQTQQGQESDQLRDIINPYLKPDIDSLRGETAALRDENTFYRKTKGAEEYEEQIEATFQQLTAAGRPMARSDIYRYLVGKMAVDEPEKFTERQNARQQRQLQTAQGAVDFGFNGVGRQEEINKFKSFDKLSVEEMEKALDGVTF